MVKTDSYQLEREGFLPSFGGYGVKKDSLEEVASKLNLKDEDKSTRESTGKCIPIRWKILCKASDSENQVYEELNTDQCSWTVGGETPY